MVVRGYPARRPATGGRAYLKGDAGAERVYLHAGTRTGAKALGFEGRATVELHELPEPVQ